MSALYAFGLGIATENAKGEYLDTFYPYPLTNINDDTAALLRGVSGRLDAGQLLALAASLEALGEMHHANIARQLTATHQSVIATPLADNSAPLSVEAAYLKLHLLSHRLVKPHETDLNGLFGLLPTSRGQIGGLLICPNWPSVSSTRACGGRYWRYRVSTSSPR